MKYRFKEFLIDRGYKSESSTGNKSTVDDYVSRIEKVCQWEGYSCFEELAENIDHLIIHYDKGGIWQKRGDQSHRSVINAMKQFKIFAHYEGYC